MKKLLAMLALLLLGGAAGVLAHRRYVDWQRAAASGALRVHGNVELRDAHLAFLDRDRLASVTVEEGARVAAGDVLATLVTDRLDAEIGAAEARLAAQRAVAKRLRDGARPQELEQGAARVAAAEIEVANAERTLARITETAASGAASVQSRDDAEAAFATASARLRVEREALALLREGPRAEEIAEAEAGAAAGVAELARLRVRRSEAELRAPVAGVIQSRLLEPGELAGPDRPVVTLAHSDRKWIRAWLPEPELGRVRPGAAASVRSDSFGGRRYPGTVGFVAPVAEFTPQNVQTEELRTQLVYELRIEVEDPHDELRLGMPVSVDIDTDPPEAR